MKKKEKRARIHRNHAKVSHFHRGQGRGSTTLGDVGAKDGRRKKEKRGKRSGLDPQGLSDARHVR